MTLTSDTMKDRITGMFLGGAIGDALFAPNETLTLEQIEKRGRITRYIRPDGHKWFDGRDAGTWTDDTQLTLVVAESLIAKGKIDLDDLAARHVKSYKHEGNLGFGSSTINSIENLVAGAHWSKSGQSDNPKHGTGNGVAMKVAPLGAFRSSNPWKKFWVEHRAEFINNLRHFALMTHGKRIAVDSAFAQVFAVDYCLRHNQSEEFSVKDFMSRVALMSDHFNYNSTDRPIARLPARLKILGEIDPALLAIEDIIAMFGGGTSYVLNSLPFSYAFFIRNPHSIETLYDVGNAGGDTDTNASIVGGLLGALNGASIFPQHLIDGLWQKERVFNTAERFYNKFFRPEESQQ